MDMLMEMEMDMVMVMVMKMVMVMVMGSRKFFKNYVVPCGSMWLHLVPCGSMWLHVVPSGSIQSIPSVFLIFPMRSAVSPSGLSAMSRSAC